MTASNATRPARHSSARALGSEAARRLAPSRWRWPAARPWTIRHAGRRLDAGRSARSAIRSWSRKSRRRISIRMARGAQWAVAVAARPADRTSPTASGRRDAGNSRLVIAVPSGGANEVAADARRRRDPRAADRSAASANRRSRSRPISAEGASDRADPRLVHALRGRGAAVRRLVDQPRRRPDEPALPEPRLRHSSATSPS